MPSASLRTAGLVDGSSAVVVPPEIVGVQASQTGNSCTQQEHVTAPPTQQEASVNGACTAPESPTWGLSDLVPFDLNTLWGGGWEELVNDDAEQIGEAYEAGILGSVLETTEDGDVELHQGNPAPNAQQKERGAKEKKKDKKMSAKGLISNFVLSIIGSTTLGLSQQMNVGGWLLPPFMVAFGALLVSENTRLVCETIEKMQREKSITVLAYPDFAKGAFGIWGKRLASVTSMCALVGMMCTSLVLESQNFNFVFPISWSWFGCRHCGRKWWSFFLTPVTVVYVFTNPGALMKKSAFLGPIVCVLTVVFAWLGAGASIVDAADIPQSCKPEQMFTPSLSQFFSLSMIVHLAQVGSYGFYSFAVIVTVPTLRSQMKDEKKTAPAAIFSYFVSLLLFLPIMFLSYAGCGGTAPENLIDGMRHDRPSGWWALNRPWETGSITAAGTALDFIVTLNILLTEAIYIPCAVMAVEASFPTVFRKGPKWAGTVMRICFIVFRLFVATCVESFVAMSALVSSLFCVCNNILIPIVAFHWMGVKQISRTRKVFHGIMFLYGCFILILGTASSIAALSPTDVDEPGVALREDISDACRSLFHDANYSLLT